MALSDDLTKLAARTKEAEDHAAAAKGKAAADLKQQAASVRASADARSTRRSRGWKPTS
jgi:hypothetical protein